MNIRLRRLLGFVLAVVTAIGFSHLAQLAIGYSFENPAPPYWTGYSTYFRAVSIFGIPIVIGGTFERRAWLFGALAAFVVFGYMAWSAHIANFPEGAITQAKYWREWCLEGMIYITLNAPMSALVGWIRFKWYPRSRFGTVKLRLIFVILALVYVGTNFFIKGLHGLYDEYRLSSAGVTTKVTRMFEDWSGVVDAVYFKPDHGEEIVVEMPPSPERRERFDRGEQILIRYVPDDVYVYRWEDEGNTSSVLARSGLVFVGLVSLGLGLLYWRRVRRGSE